MVNAEGEVWALFDGEGSGFQLAGRQGAGPSEDFDIDDAEGMENRGCAKGAAGHPPDVRGKAVGDEEETHGGFGKSESGE